MYEKANQFLIAHNTFPIIRKQHTNFRNKNSYKRLNM